MSSLDRFARAVSSVEDLSPSIRSALAAHLAPGETIRQIIFAPGQDQSSLRRGPGSRAGGWLSWRRSPDWVLALTDERLLAAMISGAAGLPQITVTPLANLLWLELGTILLYAWFAWSWGDEGTVHRQQVYFNAVSDDLFWQMLNAIRRKNVKRADPASPAREDRLAPFVDLPFKFKNLIPHRLMFPDEQAQAMVYRPAIWGQRLGVFRYQRAPATALVLSPEYLLVVQDYITNTRANYGLIGRYCLRSCIRRAALEPIQDDLWLSVTLGLHEGEETLRLLFEPAAKPELQSLIAAMLQDVKCPPTSPR